MAKGASNSQASTLGASGRSGSSGPAGPRQSAPTASGVRRRQVANGPSSSSSAPRGPNTNSNMFRFYSDDAPGLKITPTTVLVLSLCLIGFVTLLHIIGKLTN